MPRLRTDKFAGRVSYFKASEGLIDFLVLVRWLTNVNTDMVCRSDSISGLYNELNTNMLHEVKTKTIIGVKKYHTWKRCLCQILK